jgi:hypothetical protein
MLSEKIAKAERNQQWTFDFSQADPAQVMDPDTQQQLRSHGFAFSQPLRASASPHSESIASDVSYHSPVPAQNHLDQVASRSPFHYQSENWAQQQQLRQQAQGQNPIWDSVLQPSSGDGFSMNQELSNQLQGFQQDLGAFGMDMSLDSGDFHSSSWAEHSSGPNQLANISLVTPWHQAQNSPFDH